MAVTLGNYELLGRIGSGGMAEVFLARLRGVEGFAREVVVKRMRAELATRPDAVKMFLDEARLLSKLQHPNIVQVSYLGEAEGTYFIAMEFVDGPHLGRLARQGLKDGKPLSLLHAAYIVNQAADGLHHAHEAIDPTTGDALRLVHRDVSPHNILISRFGDVKVADFGVAKSTTQASETKSGVVKGKIAYMSPEQVYGEALDARSDVFALGIVLFELVTSRRLFKHKSDLVSMQRITQDDAPKASTFNADVDGELERIIEKALHRDRDQRYSSMLAFKIDLDRWISVRATGHLKSELAAYVKETAPSLEVERDAQAVSLSSPTDSLSDDKAGTVPLHDPLVQALIRERTAMTPMSDIHNAHTALETVPTGDVVPPPIGSFFPSSMGSASHVSLSTNAFGALKTNLMRSQQRFVGRRADLQSVLDAFASSSMLVTLAGPAGTGKTRLAQRYAETQLKTWSDDGGGAWFIDLTNARTVDDVVRVVADVFRVPLTSGKSLEETLDLLGTVIAARGRVMIVLDNFEQLVQFGPSTVGRWMGRAPDARFLVTSREILRLRGETVVEVPPLSIPVDVEHAMDSEAVQLFLERARAVKPGYAPAEKDGAVIAEIVRKLDGIPLAIELAAARMGVLPPTKILERLARRFDLLKGGTRSANPRQAALKSALDWSWELLSPVEQDALAQCSVFRGGFSIESAEAILDLSAHDDAPWTLDVIQALKDKSLVKTAENPDFSDEARFTMYESVREYAATQLDAMKKTEVAERNHARAFIDAAMAFSEDKSGSGQGKRNARFVNDLSNVLAAFERATSTPRAPWASPDDGLRIATALESFYAARGPFDDQVRLLNTALDVGGEEADGRLRIQALGARGRARRRLGRIPESRSDYVEALRLSKRIEDGRAEEAVVLRDLGVLASDEGRLDDAERNYKDALKMQHDVGDEKNAAVTLMYLAFLADERGQMDEARELYERARAALAAVGERRLEGLLLGNYAGWAQERGDLGAAERFIEDALRILTDVGDRTYEAPFTGYLGTLRHEQGRPDDGAATIRRSLQSMHETGNLRYESLMEGFRAAALADAGRVDEAREAMARCRTRSDALGDPRHQDCVPIFDAFLVLAAARGGCALTESTVRSASSSTLSAACNDVQGRIDDAERRVAPSAALPNGGPSPAERSDDVRRALRILKQTLAVTQGQSTT